MDGLQESMFTQTTLELEDGEIDDHLSEQSADMPTQCLLDSSLDQHEMFGTVFVTHDVEPDSPSKDISLPPGHLTHIGTVTNLACSQDSIDDITVVYDKRAGIDVEAMEEGEIEVLVKSEDLEGDVSEKHEVIQLADSDEDQEVLELRLAALESQKPKAFSKPGNIIPTKRVPTIKKAPEMKGHADKGSTGTGKYKKRETCTTSRDKRANAIQRREASSRENFKQSQPRRKAQQKNGEGKRVAESRQRHNNRQSPAGARWSYKPRSHSGQHSFKRSSEDKPLRKSTSNHATDKREHRPAKSYPVAVEKRENEKKLKDLIADVEVEQLRLQALATLVYTRESPQSSRSHSPSLPQVLPIADTSTSHLANISSLPNRQTEASLVKTSMTSTLTIPCSRGDDKQGQAGTEDLPLLSSDRVKRLPTPKNALCVPDCGGTSNHSASSQQASRRHLSEEKSEAAVEIEDSVRVQRVLRQVMSNENLFTAATRPIVSHRAEESNFTTGNQNKHSTVEAGSSRQYVKKKPLPQRIPDKTKLIAPNKYKLTNIFQERKRKMEMPRMQAVQPLMISIGSPESSEDEKTPHMEVPELKKSRPSNTKTPAAIHTLPPKVQHEYYGLKAQLAMLERLKAEEVYAKNRLTEEKLKMEESRKAVKAQKSGAESSDKECTGKYVAHLPTAKETIQTAESSDKESTGKYVAHLPTAKETIQTAEASEKSVSLATSSQLPEDIHELKRYQAQLDAKVAFKHICKLRLKKLKNAMEVIQMGLGNTDDDITILELKVAQQTAKVTGKRLKEHGIVTKLMDLPENSDECSGKLDKHAKITVGESSQQLLARTVSKCHQESCSAEMATHDVLRSEEMFDGVVNSQTATAACIDTVSDHAVNSPAATDTPSKETSSDKDSTCRQGFAGNQTINCKCYRPEDSHYLHKTVSPCYAQSIMSLAEISCFITDTVMSVCKYFPCNEVGDHATRQKITHGEAGYELILDHIKQHGLRMRRDTPWRLHTSASICYFYMSGSCEDNACQLQHVECSNRPATYSLRGASTADGCNLDTVLDTVSAADGTNGDSSISDESLAVAPTYEKWRKYLKQQDVAEKRETVSGEVLQFLCTRNKEGPWPHSYTRASSLSVCVFETLIIRAKSLHQQGRLSVMIKEMQDESQEYIGCLTVYAFCLLHMCVLCLKFTNNLPKQIESCMQADGIANVLLEEKGILLDLEWLERKQFKFLMEYFLNLLACHRSGSRAWLKVHPGLRNSNQKDLVIPQTSVLWLNFAYQCLIHMQTDKDISTETLEEILQMLKNNISHYNYIPLFFIMQCLLLEKECESLEKELVTNIENAFISGKIIRPLVKCLWKSLFHLRHNERGDATKCLEEFANFCCNKHGGVRCQSNCKSVFRELIYRTEASSVNVLLWQCYCLLLEAEGNLGQSENMYVLALESMPILDDQEKKNAVFLSYLYFIVRTEATDNLQRKLDDVVSRQKTLMKESGKNHVGFLIY